MQDLKHFLSRHIEMKELGPLNYFLSLEVSSSADDHYLTQAKYTSVTPQTRGSVDYPSTCGIQVDVGLPDATSDNRAESPLDGELYPITLPA